MKKDGWEDAVQHASGGVASLCNLRREGRGGTSSTPARPALAGLVL